MGNWTSALAVQPYRVAVTWDTFWSGLGVAANYAFVRQDNISTPITVAIVVIHTAYSVDLALSAPLQPGVVYLLTATGVTGSKAFTYFPPTAQPATIGSLEDPEAEAFGVDIDWLAGSLAQGDMPIIKGVRCLQEDLVNIANTDLGELFHKPKEGAGLPSLVNGIMSAGALASRVRAQWLKDSRVKAASPQVLFNVDGTVQIQGSVTPYAIDTQLPVSTT